MSAQTLSRNAAAFLFSGAFARRTTAFIAVAFLLFASLPVSAQTFPNLSGTGTGNRTESGSLGGLPANSSQALTLFQVSPGGNVTGMLTTWWPGTAYTWSAYVSGTISGSTLALTWTIIPSTTSSSLALGGNGGGKPIISQCHR